MNIKYVAILFGASLAMGGCVIESTGSVGGTAGSAGTSGGTAGSAGTTGGSAGTSGGTAGSAGTTGGSAGTAGTGGSGVCNHCGNFITEGGTLCEDAMDGSVLSTTYFYALLDCKCDNTCKDQCLDYCADMSKQPSEECIKCGADNSMLDPACKMAADDCNNDIN